MSISPKQHFEENILIVDDHPLTVEVHKAILCDTLQGGINCHTATTAKQAFYVLSDFAAKGEQMGLAFFDVNLPPYADKKIYSGEDLAILTRKLFPGCKIVMISMHTEPLWVNRIIKAINPEGFVAKSDVDAKLFAEICTTIQSGIFYYSDAVRKSNKVIIQQNVNWDEHDTKILQLIAEGVKTAHLTRWIPLSLSTIEKRKFNIKRQLIFESGSDKDLVEKARSMGLL